MAAPITSRSNSSVLFYVTGDFTTPKSGSHVRFSEMVDHLTGAFERVIVYGYRNNPQDPWTRDGEVRFQQRFPEAELALDTQTPWLKRLYRLKNAALMAVPQKAGAILRWRIPGSTPAYDSIMRVPSPPALLINFVDGAVELNGIDISKAVIETHDSKYVRYAKLRNIKLTDWAALSRLRSEYAVLSHASAVVAISNAEAGFFRTLCSDTKVFLIPSYVSRTEPDAFPSTEFTTDLLFVGSDNSHNRKGLLAFLVDNYEWLAQITITIAGSICDDPDIARIVKTSTNINSVGFVHDLEPVYAGAKAVISPVDGTGLNIKVSEALAHGKPVFASQHSRNALPPGFDGCVFEIDKAKIQELLGEPSLRETAQRAAIEYFNGPAMRGDAAKLIAKLK